jgi:cobalamin biosynthesis protein CobC
MDRRQTLPETVEALRHHGGNINVARRLFPQAPEPWIDLSTGINPVSYPIGAITPGAWARLPESAGLAALEAAARAAYGAGASAEIVAAPGTQALLQWLPRIFPGRRVGILGFTYAEHERCWRAAGAEVATVAALSGLAGFDVGVVVNPNNPDGRMVPPDLLAETARIMAERGGLLVVDEAFMDVFPRSGSLIARLPQAGAIVLRSFGKVYGLAGLRLGFAVGPRELGARLRSAIGPWAVSGPALEIGRRALLDEPWLAATVASLQEGADRLDRLLRLAGFDIAGGTKLFRLAQHEGAALWFERFARAGILVRPFRARPDWLRFGIPHAPAAWERLEAALRGSTASAPDATGVCPRRDSNPRPPD